MKENSRFFDHGARAVAPGGAPPHDAGDLDIDLRAILARLWRGKWAIVIGLLFGGLAGLLIASRHDPVYRAAATVMFDAPGSELVQIGDGATRPAAQDALQDQIEVLRSTTLVQKVIDALSLDQDGAFNPALAPPAPSPLDRLRTAIGPPGRALEALRNLGLAPPPALGDARGEPEGAADLARRQVLQAVRDGLELRPVPASAVIEIAFRSDDPQRAARVANAFAEQYIRDQLDANLDATRSATDWLGGRVEDLRARVQAAEEAVEGARAKQSAEAGQSLEITRQQLQALNGALSAARNDARSAEATHARLRDALASGSDFGAIPEFRDSPVMRGHLVTESDLLVEQATLARRLEEGHPMLERVGTDLEILRERMAEEAARIVRAAAAGAQAAQAELSAVEAEVRALEDLALHQSREAVAIRQLEREADASRLLYETFLARLHEASERQRLEEPGARILSPAEPPLSPMTDRRNRTLILSLMAGAAAGIALVFLRERLNNTVRSASELEEMTGAPVLGTIPAAGRRLRRGAVLAQFRDRPESALAESVRTLRTSIFFADVDRVPKVVMFTSSLPREGKSTTATLVAMTSRQMGKSVILVDCDLRMPALPGLLGGEGDGPGLLSVIEGSQPLEAAIRRDPASGLDALMTTPSEPRLSVNAADILSSRRFARLIADLRDRYDLVILDTPPALAVADPRILSALADIVVYVARWDHTPRGAVVEGLRELRRIGAPLAGIVLTMVTGTGRYGYEGYGSQRGRYRDYYVE